MVCQNYILYNVGLFFLYFVVNLEPSVQNVTERSKRQTGSGGHVKMCITWRVLHATLVSDSSPPGKSLHWAGTNCYVCGTTRLLLKETRIKVRAFLISFLLIFIFYFFLSGRHLCVCFFYFKFVSSWHLKSFMTCIFHIFWWNSSLLIKLKSVLFITQISS